MFTNLQISKTGALKKTVVVLACMLSAAIARGTLWGADAVTELELAKSNPKVQEQLRKEQRSDQLAEAVVDAITSSSDPKEIQQGVVESMVGGVLDAMGLNSAERMKREAQAEYYDRRAIEIYREIMATDKRFEEEKSNQFDLEHKLRNLPYENPFEKLIDTSSWDKQVSNYKREATVEIGDASRRIDQKLSQARQNLERQLDQVRKTYGGSPDAAAGAPRQIVLPSLNPPLSSGWQPAQSGSQPATSQPATAAVRKCRQVPIVKSMSSCVSRPGYQCDGEVPSRIVGYRTECS